MTSYICGNIDRLHEAGFGVMLVCDPVDPDVTLKPVLQARQSTRAACVSKLQRAVQIDQLHSVQLSTLQGCVSVRSLLQAPVLSAVTRLRVVGVCDAAQEADLAIAAISRTGKVHAVLTNDSDIVVHLSQVPAPVLVVDTRRAPSPKQHPKRRQLPAADETELVQVTEPWKIPAALDLAPSAVRA